MRHYPFFLFVILWLCAAPTFGQAAPAQPILPATVGGWSCGARSALDLSHPQGAVAGDPAAIANEYGYASGEHCTYTRGKESLEAQVYVMKDATAGYGEFSYLRTTDLPKATLAEHSAMSANRALVLNGNLVLDISGNLSGAQADVKALLAAVAAHSDQGPPPLLWQHLPPGGEVLRSDHYILGPVALAQFFPLAPGDWLGFSTGAEAETARYKLGRDDVNLLVADFPTPQIAAAKLTELQQKFGSASNGATPQIFAKRSATLVAIVAGAHTEKEADALLDQVQTTTQITWNEPTFQFKEPSIEMMVVGSIVGAGLICLFAVVAGLAFGGLRLVVKRVLPDKVFDRSSHLQVLQLGLNSKPINSEDFYGLSGKLIPADIANKDLPDRVALRIFR